MCSKNTFRGDVGSSFKSQENHHHHHHHHFNNSPKTSVYEKHISLINSGPLRLKRHSKIGGLNNFVSGLNMNSSDSTLTEYPNYNYQNRRQITSNRQSRFNHPNSGEISASDSVYLTIPIYKFKKVERTISDYIQSFTKEDVNRGFEVIANLFIGCFVIMGEEFLIINKQFFIIGVPIVVMSFLKILLRNDSRNVLSLKSYENSITSKVIINNNDDEHVGLRSIEQSINLKRDVSKVLFLLQMLLFGLIFKITSRFKQLSNYSSKVDVFTLLLLGSLLAGLFVKISHNATNLFTLKYEENFIKPVEQTSINSPAYSGFVDDERRETSAQIEEIHSG